MSNPVNPKVLARRGGLERKTPPSIRPCARPDGRWSTLRAASTSRSLQHRSIPTLKLPSEIEAEEHKPWYQKVWKFGGGGD